MKKHLWLLVVLLFTNCSGLIFAQSYESEFIEYFAARDTAAMRNLLTEWELTEPNDAEMYTSKFNYYLIKAHSEIAHSSNEKGVPNKTMVVRLVKSAIETIDKGIIAYPNRLDMRFGKIYALGEIGIWDSFIDELISTVQYSSINNRNWTWKGHQPKSMSADEFLENIQDYQLKLYESNVDSLIFQMGRVASEILAIYPNNIMNLSNLAVSSMYLGDYDNALSILLKASSIDSSDPVILSNIARLYEIKDEKENAIKYYRMLEKCDSHQLREYATKQISILSQ